MSAADDKGYREPCLSLMRRFGVTVWCEVRARTTRGDFEGLLLPRSETADPLHLVLKLTTGYNVGIRHALQQGAEYVCILNNDAVVAPDFLSLLAATARAEQQAGLLGPMVRMKETPDLILSAGGVLGPGHRLFLVLPFRPRGYLQVWFVGPSFS